jgi:hypothetical protein
MDIYPGLYLSLFRFIFKELCMKIKLLVAALGVAASGFAIADTYQVDLGANAVRFENDQSNHTGKVYELNGSYYFKAVETNNLPLAEAAYLGKNSNVFAGFGVSPKQNGAPNQKVYAVGAEVYIPESFLYVSAGASRYSVNHEHDHDWFTTVGVTPIDGLLVTTSYNHDSGYDANIHAKYVTSIGTGQFINVEAGLADTDFGTSTSVGGDFYLDNTFSVGANISDDDTGTEYTLRTTKFFTEQFSAGLAFTDADEGNELVVGASFRF